jgi:DNA-binding IclR family transcriptional regulator
MANKPKGASQAPDRSVAAAERTLAILDAFIGTEDPVTLGEIEKATGLFKSVIFRYMISLERKNYVTKLHDGRYRLGPKLMLLGHLYEKSFDILSIINPTLDQLAEDTGETISFYIREGKNRICIARRDSNHTLKVSVRPGSIQLVDGSSTGLVLSHFSELNAEDLGKDDLFRATSGIGDVLTCSVSIPVFGASGQFKGALTVSGPVGRFDPHSRKIRELLKAAATEISFKLGHRPTQVRLLKSGTS